MANFIGQRKAKEFVKQRKYLPNSTLIIGAKKSGKRTFARYIADELGYDCLFIDNKIDSIRDMIELSSSLAQPTLFVVSATGMSVGAKNSLLKVTEEPPKNVHICMLAQTEGDILSTLISRSWVISLLPYTVDEVAYYLERFVKSSIDIIELANIFSSPGQVNYLVQSHGKEALPLYLEKVQFFYENILEASSSNALKIVDWFKLKDSDTREDALIPELFLEVAMNYIGYRNRTVTSTDTLICNYALLKAISKCLGTVSVKGNNKLFALNKMVKELHEIG